MRAAALPLVLLCALAACSDDEPAAANGGTGGSGGDRAPVSGAGGADPPSSGASGGGTSGATGSRGGASGMDPSAGRGGRGGGSGGSGGGFVPPETCTTDDACDDGDPCTDQTCAADGECTYTNNQASCDDGDACTTGDVCAAGACTGAPTCAEGCEPGCGERIITKVVAGNGTTCARKPDGVIRCWGDNEIGEAGYPADTEVGGDVDIGKPVVQVAIGGLHGCGLLEDGAVRCWGSGAYGRLGYGSPLSIGDEPGETPADAGDLDLGDEAVSVAVSADHSCAALVDGSVRCWGAGGAKLGYGDGDVEDVGVTNTPAERGVVDVGGHAVQIAVGANNSCALLAGGTVRCWGAPDGLGTLALFPIGDDETPGSAAPIDLGGTATQIGVGSTHACALLEDGTVRCWGRPQSGRLGYGDTQIVGDDETPREKGPVDVGGTVTQIAVGMHHTCALLSDRSVRCWGEADGGRLGYGNLEDIGDNETPDSLPNPVDVGGDVDYLSAGGSHTCAVLVSGALRCWGSGLFGQLGYGGMDDIGDNEAPSSAGDVPWLE